MYCIIHDVVMYTWRMDGPICNISADQGKQVGRRAVESCQKARRGKFPMDNKGM